ncbi:TPA: single-stranded DNA-binding protein [Streptococcus suis]
MNQVVLVGRIVREIELRTVNDNRAVVNNVIAVNRKHRDKQGELQTDFINFVAWGNLASLLEKYCQKGQRIAISGPIHSRSYVTQDQQTRYLTEVLVQDLTLLDRPQNRETEDEPVQFGMGADAILS